MSQELLQQLMEEISPLSVSEKKEVLKRLEQDLADEQAVEEQKKKNQAARALIKEWLEDESSYDEWAWNKLEPILEGKLGKVGESTSNE